MNAHGGHRERMREKFLRLRGGADLFDSYELLEMLLYYSIPVKDTNPIAKGLLSRFSTLDGVFRATREELLSVPEVGGQSADLILAAGVFSEVPELLSDGNGALLDSREKLRDRIIDHFAGRSDHSVVMLSLDNRLSVIAEDEIYPADYCSAGVKPEVIVKTAIRRGASVVVLGHNHPNSTPYPTDGDYATERIVRAEMKAAGISYPFHFIVSGNRALEIPNDSRLLFSSDNAAKNLFCQTENSEIFKQLFADKDKKCAKTGSLLDRALSVPFGEEDAAKTAAALLSAYPSLSHILENPPADLVRRAGIGMNEALYLRLALELFLRRTTERFRFGKRYTTEEILQYLYARFLDRMEENVLLLPVDDAGRILGEELLFIGAVNSSQVLPRKILECADRYDVKSVILAHNHPSGMPDCSPEDIRAVTTLLQTLDLFGIRLIASYSIAGYAFSDAVACLKT